MSFRHEFCWSDSQANYEIDDIENGILNNDKFNQIRIKCDLH